MFARCSALFGHDFAQTFRGFREQKARRTGALRSGVIAFLV
jgi:hypothetical protein